MSGFGLDDATKAAALALLGTIVKKPFERIGEIIDTRMSYWQFRNMYAVGERSRDFLAKKGMDIADLPPKLREVVPILESAKNENDPTLQEMWASLLAASLDPDVSEAVLPFNELLRSITPFEARVLAVLGPSGTGLIDFLTPDDEYSVQVEKLAGILSIDAKTTGLALRHLEHLGLILTPETETLSSYLTYKGDGPKAFITGSEVGRAFLQRCTYMADNA